MTTPPLTVRLEPALQRRLQAAAADQGVTVSDFVRDAIRQRLETGAVETSLWDRIEPLVLGGRRSRRRRPDASKAHEEFARGLEADAKRWRSP
jgi:hypothetical protein